MQQYIDALGIPKQIIEITKLSAIKIPKKEIRNASDKYFKSDFFSNRAKINIPNRHVIDTLYES